MNLNLIHFMKSDVQYNDFKGTAAADIADYLGGGQGDDLSSLAKRFKLDQERFTIVGISIYGVSDPSISLICIDKEQSQEGKEYIVKMRYDMEEDGPALNSLFKRFHVVLHDKYDDKYPGLDYNEEVRFSQFHSNVEETGL